MLQDLVNANVASCVVAIKVIIQSKTWLGEVKYRKTREDHFIGKW